MQISARCDYACKALLELALHWPNENPLQIQVISRRQKIPIKYLVQILIQLKRMGLVESTRGKDGGYALTTAPEKISLADVVSRVGGSLLSAANSVKKNKSIFTIIWDEAAENISRYLDRINFEDIVNRTKGIAYQI